LAAPQETIEKTDAQGKLLPEMILICQNLRNNLQHPNEYIRGVTLRFLCRIHEEELLEPLVPSGEGTRPLLCFSSAAAPCLCNPWLCALLPQ
jgi:hypothetical protein